ncbi:septum site-determining protein MinC [Atopomonas sediminilitoris]|uniref:septum site-determining protein MinC n=1 Tax=Atopomonas sediminilitoris TaxID=2919919 RepID=UPI001F4E5271|nr:septum site-determining protein MinC [Atopomonas sediminilitoris]MCJ8170084.1 septum site-determining protein MinC [Atopomonas sediminilitoris]
MSQADLLDQDPVFQLKGSMLAVTILELVHNDLERLDRQLAEKVAQAPGLFQNTPLVLGLDKLPAVETAFDLTELMAVCRRHGLRTLAVRTAREQDVAAANALDLPILPPSGARERAIELAPAQSKPAAKPPEPARATSKIIRTPVRGGQQIYAAGGDLIVLAPVSAGAELLADGNIHVYGPLRGRALAGVKGDSAAAVFCQSLNAELVSIAGVYKVAEDLRRLPHWGKSVHVSLSDEMLNIHLL